MSVEESCWIPGMTEKDKRKPTLSDIGWILKGVLRGEETFDENLLKGRFPAAVKALSPMSEMVRVRSGSFRMGHTREDREMDRVDLEYYAHHVTLTYDYWIGRYPVTFWEYDHFCDSVHKEKPRDRIAYDLSKRKLYPVIFVDWFDAIKYCNWLSEREGLKPAFDVKGNLLDAQGNKTSDLKKVEGYRLPTEAEWEYAARGGHKSTKDYQFSGTDNEREIETGDEYSWPVGLTKPNDLGLFDMSSLVWEWCYDWYFYYPFPTFRTDPIGPLKGEKRVIRGGGFGEWYRMVVYHVAYREEDLPDRKYFETGFRVARTCRSGE